MQHPGLDPVIRDFVRTLYRLDRMRAYAARQGNLPLLSLMVAQEAEKTDHHRLIEAAARDVVNDVGGL